LVVLYNSEYTIDGVVSSIGIKIGIPRTITDFVGGKIFCGK
jgi:hypothetical protein